jgi:hypothetical protein
MHASTPASRQAGGTAPGPRASDGCVCQDNNALSSFGSAWRRSGSIKSSRLTARNHTLTRQSILCCACTRRSSARLASAVRQRRVLLLASWSSTRALALPRVQVEQKWAMVPPLALSVCQALLLLSRKRDQYLAFGLARPAQPLSAAGSRVRVSRSAHVVQLAFRLSAERARLALEAVQTYQQHKSRTVQRTASVFSTTLENVSCRPGLAHHLSSRLAAGSGFRHATPLPDPSVGR